MKYTDILLELEPHGLADVLKADLEKYFPENIYSQMKSINFMSTQAFIRKTIGALAVLNVTDRFLFWSNVNNYFIIPESVRPKRFSEDWAEKVFDASDLDVVTVDHLRKLD